MPVSIRWAFQLFFLEGSCAFYLGQNLLPLFLACEATLVLWGSWAYGVDIAFIEFHIQGISEKVSYFDKAESWEFHFRELYLLEVSAVRIFFEGRIRIFDVFGGRILWRIRIPWRISGCPPVSGYRPISGYPSVSDSSRGLVDGYP